MNKYHRIPENAKLEGIHNDHWVQLRRSFPVHIIKYSVNYFNLTKIPQHLETIFKPLVRPYLPLVLQKVPVSTISNYFSHVD